MKPPERSNERTALDEVLFILRRLTPGERERVRARFESEVWGCIEPVRLAVPQTDAQVTMLGGLPDAPDRSAP